MRRLLLLPSCLIHVQYEERLHDVNLEEDGDADGSESAAEPFSIASSKEFQYTHNEKRNCAEDNNMKECGDLCQADML